MSNNIVHKLNCTAPHLHKYDCLIYTTHLSLSKDCGYLRNVQIIVKCGAAHVPWHTSYQSKILDLKSVYSSYMWWWSRFLYSTAIFLQKVNFYNKSLYWRPSRDLVKMICLICRIPYLMFLAKWLKWISHVLLSYSKFKINF